MLAKVFALFALLAVAFASPKPDVLTYAAAPGVYSAYGAPLAYPGAYPYAAGAYPYTAAAYSYPYGYSSYYVK